jgi:L-lactate dehydrogenase complex protein LldE
MPDPMDKPPATQPREGNAPVVYLFATCLADLLRPAVAWSALELLEHAGYEVVVPTNQTCCGQPGYNSGDYRATIPLAKSVVALLESADYVVVPSGSCAGMIVHHYPRLLEGEWRERALRVAAKTLELTTFLREVAGLETAPARHTPMAAVAYHDGCAGLREMGVREQPRALLQNLCGIEVRELQQRDSCCGFGGTFCAKMPEISAKMADDKLDDAIATGATMLTGGDLGCLLSLAGRARRRGLDLEFRHVAELLCGRLDEPGIAEGEG